VGAAIARGSHGENGKIALLVIKVTTKNTGRIGVRYKDPNLNPLYPVKEKYRATVVKKKQSPKRFINRVNRPELIED
jgi:hypothetical protein